MSGIHLLLLLAAAGLHVVQHAAIRSARDRSAFLWWMWLWAVVLVAPVAVTRWRPPPPEIFPWLLLSALFEILYFRAIARAYDRGPLSTVYPIARGSAPPLLVAWCGLFLGEWPRLGGAPGIAIVVAGIAMVHAPSTPSWRRLVEDWRSSASRWAVAAGLCISLYTLVDRIAVRRVDPVPYAYFVMVATLIGLSAAWLRPSGRSALIVEGRRSPLRAAVAGCSALASYSLVLVVIAQGVPASYVGAVREVSVVLGALTGWFVLREPGAGGRIPGAVAVAVGVAMITLLG